MSHIELATLGAGFMITILTLLGILLRGLRKFSRLVELPDKVDEIRDELRHINDGFSNLRDDVLGWRIHHLEEQHGHEPPPGGRWRL